MRSPAVIMRTAASDRLRSTYSHCGTRITADHSAKDARTDCKRASNALRKMPERIAKGHRLQGIVHQNVTPPALFRAILSSLIVRNSMPTACSAHRFRTPGYCLPTLYQSAKLINKHPTDKYISDKTHFIRLSLALFVFVGLQIFTL